MSESAKKPVIVPADRSGDIPDTVFQWRGWTIPATADGVHRIGVAPFIGLRAVAIVQLVLATVTGQVQTLNPTIYWTAFAIFIIEGVAAAWWMQRRQSPVLPRLAVIDVCTMCVLLLAQVLYAPPELRLSTWEAWGFGVSLSTLVIAGIAFRPLWQNLVAAGALATCYLVSVAPSAWQQGHPATALANASGFLANVIVVKLLWTLLLKLASAADAARVEVDELARRSERDQQRRLMHGPAGLLSLLANADDMGPEARKAVRKQAIAAANTIRAFLNDEDQRISNTSLNLADTLRALANEYADLNVTVIADLADVELKSGVHRAVREAIANLLDNVRTHACATECILHGDAEGDTWEVVVRDNGVGFNPSAPTERFGLERFVRTALPDVGVHASIKSSPGEGTTVTLTGHVDREWNRPLR